MEVVAVVQVSLAVTEVQVGAVKLVEQEAQEIPHQLLHLKETMEKLEQLAVAVAVELDK